MTALRDPATAHAASWIATMREFHAGGEEHVHGAGLWDLESVDLTEAGCAVVVEHLRAQADPATELADNLVHCTYLWITDGDPEEVVGFLALRHALTPWLLEEGGHIGYAVRPSRRRQGHASRALALAVRRAGELGIARALVTCDEDNDGSRRTIERCGGVYEDSRNGKRRYWIDTAASGPEKE
ncbi:GNAT family N-acetyltransferase [Nocardioides conyzicola]|uniref:GNAT family N-acetyltransferase n=1 Tax=Nocardioides conyzicola TaxID=1651781 RepID=A0ABP8XJS8_9ACTN